MPSPLSFSSSSASSRPQRGSGQAQGQEEDEALRSLPVVQCFDLRYSYHNPFRHQRARESPQASSSASSLSSSHSQDPSPLQPRRRNEEEEEEEEESWRLLLHHHHHHDQPPSGVSLSREFLDSLASAEVRAFSRKEEEETQEEEEEAEEAGDRTEKKREGSREEGGGRGECGDESQEEFQLKNISLEIPSSSRVVVVGSNGAGKSTFLNILGGKMMIPEGKVLVLGRPAFHDVTLGREVSCLSEWWKGDFSLDVPLYDLIGPVIEDHIRAVLSTDRHPHHQGHSSSSSSSFSSSRSYVHLFHGSGLYSPSPCCHASSFHQSSFSSSSTSRRRPGAGGSAPLLNGAHPSSSPSDKTLRTEEREDEEKRKGGEREQGGRRGRGGGGGCGREECLVSRVRRLVMLLGVDVRWRIARISDGERRRCQLLAALCEPKKLYILDEATSDLDLVSREGLLRLLLHESRDLGATVIYSTHIFDGLDLWATHLLYLRKGRVKLFKPLSQISQLEDLKRESAEERLPSAPLYSLVRRWLFEERQHQPQLHTLEQL